MFPASDVNWPCPAITRAVGLGFAWTAFLKKLPRENGLEMSMTKRLPWRFGHSSLTS